MRFRELLERDQMYGKKLFDPILGSGEEPDTKRERAFLKQLQKFFDGAPDIDRQYVKDAYYLKGNPNFKQWTDPKAKTVYRGSAMDFYDIRKNIKNLERQFGVFVLKDYVWTPHKNFTSFSTERVTAERFNKKRTGEHYVMEANTRGNNFLFNPDLSNEISNFQEDEVIYFDKKSMKANLYFEGGDLTERLRFYLADKIVCVSNKTKEERVYRKGKELDADFQIDKETDGLPKRLEWTSELQNLIIEGRHLIKLYYKNKLFDTVQSNRYL